MTEASITYFSRPSSISFSMMFFGGNVHPEIPLEHAPEGALVEVRESEKRALPPPPLPLMAVGEPEAVSMSSSSRFFRLRCGSRPVW